MNGDAAVSSGAIRFNGADLMLKSEREMRGIRGADIAMIFQEPMTALNPLYTVGNQIGEVLELHEGLESNELLLDLDRLAVPLIVTSFHQGQLLHQQVLPKPCAWVMGHEGQGVCAELMQRAALAVRIGQPGGEESLNVAAAAAICLHASAVGAVVKSL